MPLVVKCSKCSRENTFDQPCRYHAGFGNQGFMYNEAGILTLVWSSYDPGYVALVGSKHPWDLSKSDQRALEEALLPSPSGDRWLFANPARCLGCAAIIGEPIGREIYYLKYQGSVDAEAPPGSFGAHLRRASG